MRKIIFLFFFFLILSIKPVLASENTCPPYPVISNCNLNYIMETNVSSLTRLVSGGNQGVASLIGLTLQTPPVSGRDFLAYERTKFHIPGTAFPAYAAYGPGGLGYSSLGPVLQIWVVMRNLAYLVFAIIFIVIGIMILIRSKIDPKTTVDIQNALPKIILALVLVTFSYAIAGFLIDIMYVALALVLTIAGSMNIGINGPVIGNTTAKLGQNVLEHNLFWAWFDPSVNVWGTIGNGAQAVNTLLQTFLGQRGEIGGSIIGNLGGGIALLIIAIAILWALFKTWLSLLSAYANTILGIIFSPLQLMMDAIPGQNQFEGWLRTMLSNLLAFPAVLAMILIGLILANTNENNPGGQLGFSPPLIGASNQQAIQALIGIAIILTIPKTVEILQETLKAPKSKWGSAWGEAVGWAVQKPMAGAWNRGSKYAGNQIFGEEADRARAVKEAWLKQEAQEVLDAAAARRAPIRNPAPQRNIGARIGQAVGASKG